jgi:hypothetical protein
MARNSSPIAPWVLCALLAPITAMGGVRNLPIAPTIGFEISIDRDTA